MKTVAIFLLFASVSLGALVPVEEAPVQKVEAEVKVESKPEVVEEELPALGPEVHSQLCLPGWEFFRGSCYHLNNDYRTWRDAVSYCANFEATLASVHSYLENNHFQHMAGSAGHTTAWTGGYYFEGEWRWQDGSHMSYKNFESYSSTSYRCVRMNTQAYRGWYNTDCSSSAPSICQIRVNC